MVIREYNKATQNKNAQIKTITKIYAKYRFNWNVSQDLGCDGINRVSIAFGDYLRRQEALGHKVIIEEYDAFE